MPPDASSSQPLLPSYSASNGSKAKAVSIASSNSSDSDSNSEIPETVAHRTARYITFYHFCQGNVRAFLSSRAQHYTVLALVSCDLLGIFADIIINLYQCDEKDTSPIWDDVRNGLGTAGFVFTFMFLFELILSVWAFGWSYFNSAFHTFDAIIIIAGFVIDVLLHGVLEEVASLVVVLRLWRFFKIIEEFTVGAEEQMDGLELRIEQLESENADLKEALAKTKGGRENRGYDEDEEMGFGFGKAKRGSGSGAGMWSR